MAADRRQRTKSKAWWNSPAVAITNFFAGILGLVIGTAGLIVGIIGLVSTILAHPIWTSARSPEPNGTTVPLGGVYVGPTLMIIVSAALVSVVSRAVGGILKRAEMPTELTKARLVAAIYFGSGIIGAALSLTIFSGTLTRAGLWPITLLVSAVGVLFAYASKIAGESRERKSLSVLDLLNVITQGFLWATMWPVLVHHLSG